MEEILTRYSTAVEDHEETEEIIQEISNNICDMASTEEFYKLPFEIIKIIIKQGASVITTKKASELTDKILKTFGLQGLQIIPIIRCNEVVSIFGRTTELIEADLAKAKAEVVKREDKIAELKEVIAEYRARDVFTPRSPVNSPESTATQRSLRTPEVMPFSPRTRKVDRSEQHTPDKRAKTDRGPELTPLAPARCVERPKKTVPLPLLSTLFSSASNNNIPSLLKVLTDHPEIVNEKVNGETALHCAMRAKDTAAASALLDQGADIEASNRFGAPPLFNAVYEDDTACIDFLKGRGADLMRTNHNGDTALHWAAKCGKDRAAKFLIECGVDVNVRNHEGEIPLHLAVPHGSQALIVMLVEAGSEVNAKTLNNKSVLDCAGNPDVREYLIQHGAI